jgi:hypothetical protein
MGEASPLSVTTGCAAERTTTQPPAGDSPASSPTSSPAPACDPDAAFLIGAIRMYATDKATLLKHMSGFDPGPFRVFAGKVRRLRTDVAARTVATSLFTARDQELQAFTRILMGAEGIAANGAAGVDTAKQAIDGGEAQLNQVGASLSDAVAACR